MKTDTNPNTMKTESDRELALKILQEETDGFESQSRLRDDILDAMLRLLTETKK